MYVVAVTMQEAISDWAKQIAKENEGMECIPLGVQFICDDREFMIAGHVLDNGPPPTESADAH